MPQAKLFPSALGIHTKGHQHWKREGGSLGLFLWNGIGILGRRGEFSIQCLNVFATACSFPSISNMWTLALLIEMGPHMDREKPMTSRLDHRCSTDWATRSDGSRSWEFKMSMSPQWIWTNTRKGYAFANGMGPQTDREKLWPRWELNTRPLGSSVGRAAVM